MSSVPSSGHLMGRVVGAGILTAIWVAVANVLRGIVPSAARTRKPRESR